MGSAVWRRGVDENEYPNVKRWVKLVNERPAVKRGIEVLADERSSDSFSAAEHQVLFGTTQFKKR